MKPSRFTRQQNHLLYLFRWMLTAVFVFTQSIQAADQFGLVNNAVAPEFQFVELTVTNDDGKLVPGASVIPVAFASKNGLHHWDETPWGALPVGTSDQHGRAKIRIPKLTPDRERILVVHWAVRHRDYVADSFKSRSDQHSVQCELKPGRRIAVSAIDGETRQRLQSDTFAVLSGRAVTDHWSQMKSGILVSDGLAVSRRVLRIVHLPPDQPARFSKAIDLSSYQDKSRIFLRNIAVSPGTRIEGRLNDLVPRPVQQGIVSACVVQGKNEWHEMARINKDGTFVIDTLPPGEVAQLTASCAGWVSSDPTVAELEAVGMKNKASRLQRSRVYPQVIPLEGDVIHPVIRMEPATTCRIEVVEAGGSPVQGARVRLIPYQGSFDGRSHIFGYGESSRRRLLSDSVSISVGRRIALGIVRDIHDRFLARTGADGIAEITSLPGGPEGSPAMTSFVVTHPDYFAATTRGLGDQGSSRAALYSGKTTEVLVRMKRK